MTTTETPRTIFVTQQDAERLQGLIDTHGRSRERAMVDALEAELERAVLLDPESVPPNVVTMNSRVRYLDEVTGTVHEVTVVYPRDADATQGRISVLAPVGTALLGLLVGQQIAWRMPGGGTRRLRVLGIPYQPEAAGDRHL